ncbi:UNVERIFIED_CONTAM: hypothetical protein Sradi_3626400 [Sesamum radiatum]|uniref:Uncharacterized protein n=1 Tax=Sesamum radiatum TaxID=300843 RepID=A0AAW2QHT0_SESRA
MGCGRGTVCGEKFVGAEGHFKTERSKEREVDLLSHDTKSEYWALHTHQSLYVLTRTSTNRVGENVTGRSLDKTAGCDLQRTCGQLRDVGRHAGARTALEQRL